MVGERGDQDSQDDRDRLAIARRQHQGQKLRLVADLGHGDDRGGNEKRFHGALFAQKERIG